MILSVVSGWGRCRSVKCCLSRKFLIFMSAPVASEKEDLICSPWSVTRGMRMGPPKSRASSQSEICTPISHRSVKFQTIELERICHAAPNICIFQEPDRSV